jgi:hypothetical protein
MNVPSTFIEAQLFSILELEAEKRPSIISVFSDLICKLN